MQGTTNAAMKRNSFGDESEMELVHWSVSFFNNHKYTCGALSRHMHVESTVLCTIQMDSSQRQKFMEIE